MHRESGGEMEPGTSEWNALTARLEKLEKQNRRTKQVGIVILILIGSVLLMGQAATKTTLEANEFLLKDATGKVRGRLDISNAEPQLVFTHNEKSGSILNGNGLTFINGDSIAILRTEQGSNGPTSALRLIGPGESEGSFGVNANGIALELSDEQAFSTRIGNTSLSSPQTGESHNTSAASVVLLNNEDKIIWRAP
jgi:hypothetical protein